MRKQTVIVLATGALAGAGLVLLDSLAGRKKHVITIEQEMPVPARKVIDLIKQVEREPESIPIISSVTLHSRTELSARYTVRVASMMPACVNYRKWWDYEAAAVYWTSQSGTLGFHNNGEIIFTEKNGGSVARLTSEHWLTAPVVGRISSVAATPIIKVSLENWLKYLAEELSGGK
jgi:hypothetical protein